MADLSGYNPVTSPTAPTAAPQPTPNDLIIYDPKTGQTVRAKGFVKPQAPSSNETVIVELVVGG